MSFQVIKEFENEIYLAFLFVERLLEFIDGALCHISQKWGQAVEKLGTVHLKSLLSCCSSFLQKGALAHSLGLA